MKKVKERLLKETLKYFMEETIFANIVTVFFLIRALSLSRRNFICASLFQFRHQ